MAAMGIIATFGDAQKDIVKSNELTLPKDTSIKVYNFYGAFGYRFFDDKRIMVTPTVGIGSPGTTVLLPMVKQDKSFSKRLAQIRKVAAVF